ncbi:hypothetical protein LOD99_9921 [Oopsacas minuta]|uniref:Uncharacterized protein n=1 Tax=Oopsacas minuta TaxID=111878 RepID=A0AAV7KKB2_9METZ|nr:hypothetical protein LOD99_9921 [Oopsacas minuta]
MSYGQRQVTLGDARSSHNENILVSAKHFDSDDIVDTQTHLKIDGQTKIRSIKATLKKCPIPKYLPGYPDRLKDHAIKYPRLDRDH